MRHIDSLVKKQDNGEQLDEQQLKAIGRLEEILQDMAQYMASKGGEAQSEEEEQAIEEEEEVIEVPVSKKGKSQNKKPRR
jgi:hypothetical protein